MSGIVHPIRHEQEKFPKRLAIFRNAILFLLLLLAPQMGETAREASLPTIDPAGERLLEAFLANDAATAYSGKKSLRACGWISGIRW